LVSWNAGCLDQHKKPGSLSDLARWIQTLVNGWAHSGNTSELDSLNSTMNCGSLDK